MEYSELDKAAEIYSCAHYKSPVGSRLYIYKSDAFKAGSKWQYEQSKELINIMQRLLSAYDFRYPNECQLLVGYTNTEAFEKINTLIRQYHDQY